MEDIKDKTMAFKYMMATNIWVSGQLLEFIVDNKLFNKFYRFFRNNSADKDDFNALETILRTIKEFREEAKE